MSKVRYLHAQKKVFLESKTKQGGRATDLTVFFFRLKYKREVLNYHVEKKNLIIAQNKTLLCRSTYHHYRADVSSSPVYFS